MYMCVHSSVGGVCVHTCVYTQVWGSAHLCTGTWEPEIKFRHPSSGGSYCVLERGSLSGLELTTQVAFLVWKPQGSVYFHPTSTEIPSTDHHVQLLYVSSGEQTGLHSYKPSTSLTELSLQPQGSLQGAGFELTLCSKKAYETVLLIERGRLEMRKRSQPHHH